MLNKEFAFDIIFHISELYMEVDDMPVKIKMLLLVLLSAILVLNTSFVNASGSLTGKDVPKFDKGIIVTKIDDNTANLIIERDKLPDGMQGFVNISVMVS